MSELTLSGSEEIAVEVLKKAVKSFNEWRKVDDCMTNGGMCVDCLNEPGRGMCEHKRDLADGIADVMQAARNLAERYGIDLQAAMERREKRNSDRGRC